MSPKATRATARASYGATHHRNQPGLLRLEELYPAPHRAGAGGDKRYVNSDLVNGEKVDLLVKFVETDGVYAHIPADDEAGISPP